VRTPAATLLAWKTQAGGWDGLINRSSTTWRGLPSNRKSPGSDAEWTLLLKEYPALIRRPVLIDAAGALLQGFTDSKYKSHFGIGLK
jgi:arsenate reductase-like glutaredoxin family protein